MEKLLVEILVFLFRKRRLNLPYTKVLKIQYHIICPKEYHRTRICYYIVFGLSTICLIEFLVRSISIPPTTICKICYYGVLMMMGPSNVCRIYFDITGYLYIFPLCRT